MRAEPVRKALRDAGMTVARGRAAVTRSTRRSPPHRHRAGGRRWFRFGAPVVVAAEAQSAPPVRPSRSPPPRGPLGGIMRPLSQPSRSFSPVFPRSAPRSRSAPRHAEGPQQRPGAAEASPRDSTSSARSSRKTPSVVGPGRRRDDTRGELDAATTVSMRDPFRSGVAVETLERLMRGSRPRHRTSTSSSRPSGAARPHPGTPAEDRPPRRK